jgi:hypothetical protein
MANTGGQARHPVATERLMAFWAHGEGAAKIRWATPGDHTRCVRLIQEAITKDGKPPLPDHEIHGLCTNLQKMATGKAHDPADFQGHGNRGHH